MKQTTLLRFQTHPLCNKGERIHYRLYRLQSIGSTACYQLQITFRADCKTCSLSVEDEREAKRIYDLIVRGRVTPCCLSDVLEDIGV